MRASRGKASQIWMPLTLVAMGRCSDIIVLGRPGAYAVAASTVWIVAVEGKGPDLAMEFCKAGDHDKDFVRNVRCYAPGGYDVLADNQWVSRECCRDETEDIRALQRYNGTSKETNG
mgnify:CR=1 FL=1